MNPGQIFSTDQVPATDRAGYWGDIVWRAFGRLRSDCYGDEQFRGRIDQFDLGNVRLCRLQASRHRVVRTAGSGAPSDPGYLKMVIQQRGHSVFEQDGRRAWLAPGCWSVYDTTRSYTVSNPEAVEQHVLLLPRRTLLENGEFERLLVRRLPALSGMSRLALETVSLALAEVDGASPHLRPALGEAILGMVRLALREQLGERPPVSAREVMRERIKEYVERRLGDPHLSIDEVARALNCSKRTLHKAFEDEGCSLQQYLWTRRLDAARRGLEAGRDAPRSITSVAFACGFSSAAHFSRTFRARYGMSPREWHAGQRAAPAPRPTVEKP